MGKGSTQRRRQVSRQAYEKNWVRVFGSKRRRGPIAVPKRTIGKTLPFEVLAIGDTPPPLFEGGQT